MATLVQFDFPAQSPGGAPMSVAYSELAQGVAAEPGLRWKIWTENAETRMAGGIYLFDDETLAQAYAAKHAKRLESLGVRDIRALLLDVDEAVSQSTRGPLD